MGAYYSEWDPFAAAWLRELIKRRLIAPGDVDERSIVDVRSDDLRGYTQCHFFAGIGGWSYALRLAGWPDDRPVWTGSCPCQPFSAAGKRKAHDDERHLWPAFASLIGECRPQLVLGEQVGGTIGLAWFDHVRADLEAWDYAAGLAAFGACDVGAPHIRQRLYWCGMADSNSRRERRNARVLGSAQREDEGDESVARRTSQAAIGNGAVGGMAHADAAGLGLERGAGLLDGERAAQRHDPDRRGADGGVEHSEAVRRQPGPLLRRSDAEGNYQAEQGVEPGDRRADGGVGDAALAGLEGYGRPREGAGVAGSGRNLGAGGAPGNFWSDAEWLPCRDGKSRPVGRGIHPLVVGDASGSRHSRRGSETLHRGRDRGEPLASLDGSSVFGREGQPQPGVEPMVDGPTESLVRGGDSDEAFDANATSEARVQRLRGYGNAIVAPAAAEFVRVVMDVIDGERLAA